MLPKVLFLVYSDYINEVGETSYAKYKVENLEGVKTSARICIVDPEKVFGAPLGMNPTNNVEAIFEDALKILSFEAFKLANCA